MTSPQQDLLRGGCHCGAVRFTVRVPRPLRVLDCDCSICRMTGYLHLIVPAEDFTLLAGEAALGEYRFNTGVARHRFCSTCGVKSFYVPRSHPDGISVNARCLDSVGLDDLAIAPFAGSEWERNIAAITTERGA